MAGCQYCINCLDIADTVCGLNAALVFDIGPIRILPNVASTILAGLFHKIGGLEPEGWNC